MRTNDSPTNPKHRFAVVSTPRSGSTFFCEQLENTRLLGKPREWFNLRYVQAYAQLMGLSSVDTASYVDFLEKKTTSQNGVFSVNFHVHQFAQMRERNFSIFDLSFDSIYYLERQDKVAQAYSFSKADKSDNWTGHTAAAAAPADVSLPELLVSLARLMHEQKIYEKDILSRTRQTFKFEEFTQNIQEPVSGILRSLDLPSRTACICSNREKKQQTSQDKAAIEAFRGQILALAAASS